MSDDLIYLVLGGVLAQCGISLGRYLERKKYGNQLYENYMKSKENAQDRFNKGIQRGRLETIVDQELLEAIKEREDKFKKAKGNSQKTRELIKEIMASPKVRLAWRNYSDG